MKIFLDCGYYVGKALEYYAPFMDDDWLVYVFEPNEDLGVEQSLKRFPFKTEWIKKAVWTEDGTVDFAIGGRNDASFVKDMHAGAVITDPIRKVECIDFSKFVADLPGDATIACSMDIEGCEFPVLRKMLKDGTAKRLTLLDIEFHHRLIRGEDEASASLLRRQLEAEGVLVKLKIPLE
jgi:FkbM family methyltransferase